MNYETAALADIMSKNYVYTIVDDTDVAFTVRYIGAQASATVTSVSSDITFQHGALAAEAVDATIDSGGDDPGVIDVSDANANTIGEVVGLINASANWEAKMVDCQAAQASAANFLDLGEYTLTPNTEFVNILKDTSGNLTLGKLCSYRGIEVHRGNSIGTPFASETGKIVTLNKVVSTNTFGSGTSIITIVDIDLATGTEVTLYTRAGGATTVEQSLDFYADVGGLSALDVGHALLVLMTGSAACTGEITVYWNMKDYTNTFS
jgi:hypothetical protein